MRYPGRVIFPVAVQQAGAHRKSFSGAITSGVFKMIVEVPGVDALTLREGELLGKEEMLAKQNEKRSDGKEGHQWGIFKRKERTKESNDWDYSES